MLYIYIYIKSNILDLMFCTNELINSISISDTFISDHCMIIDEIYIPVSFNPLSNAILTNLAELYFL